MVIDIEAYYHKYGPMILRRCRQMLGNEDDALDALQDVFVKLINAKANLHGQFPSSLLYTMATNTCLNRIRWKKRHRESSRDPEEFDPPSKDRELDQAEARIIMEGILETESGLTRGICFMYHIDGMTLKEIGELVGMSVSGVRKRLSAFMVRARKKLDGGSRYE
ncbi:MAG: sigma-70 family RNA polymerase sigma factor [Spirochaetaceae bacterium]|jgi:RNA polymerase sigma-70 factor (ECF subfamily)|nr:sigma-70 family RNA polymerase sigma factor [Spirochaetaceae bacterium]